MNLDMSVVFINLLELFLLIGVGALCGRARIFSGRDAQGVLDPPHQDYGAMDMDWKDREKSQDQDS